MDEMEVQEVLEDVHKMEEMEGTQVMEVLKVLEALVVLKDLGVLVVLEVLEALEEIGIGESYQIGTWLELNETMTLVMVLLHCKLDHCYILNNLSLLRLKHGYIFNDVI